MSLVQTPYRAWSRTFRSLVDAVRQTVAAHRIRFRALESQQRVTSSSPTFRLTTLSHARPSPSISGTRPRASLLGLREVGILAGFPIPVDRFGGAALRHSRIHLVQEGTRVAWFLRVNPKKNTSKHHRRYRTMKNLKLLFLSPVSLRNCTLIRNQGD